MDLRDLFKPGGGPSRLTWRLLGVLIRNLPMESATKTAMRNSMSGTELEAAGKAADPSEGQWSQEEMLLARVHDAIRHLEWALIRVNGGKGKPPEPMPRPGVQPKGRKPKLTARQAEARAQAIFDRINGGTLSGTWVSTPPGKATRTQLDPPPA
ncbi:hypothetical protein [Acrocarpospora sp. B8E8]|uniref:hypothetical protein n=1 Tax=Acrocarpospora sp. B8E8 TaxID=3153572 RepID=UPI00325CFF79